MRGLATAVAVSLALAGVVPASGQGVVDGPLAAPVAPRVLATATMAKQRKTAHRHVATKTAPPVPILAGEIPDRHKLPAPQLSTKKGDDPLSLGMKWNGSNDNGSQTRVQNYNGTAAGTGAEVGLKLRF